MQLQLFTLFDMGSRLFISYIYELIKSFSYFVNAEQSDEIARNGLEFWGIMCKGYGCNLYSSSEDVKRDGNEEYISSDYGFNAKTTTSIDIVSGYYDKAFQIVMDILKVFIDKNEDFLLLEEYDKVVLRYENGILYSEYLDYSIKIPFERLNKEVHPYTEYLNR